MQAEDKNLLKKYLYGQCNPKEYLRVHELLKHPDLQDVMQELTSGEWDEPSGPDEEVNEIVGDWKTKLNSRILSSESAYPKKTAFNKHVKKQVVLRYAAVWAGVFLMAMLAVWQIRTFDNTQHLELRQITNRQGKPLKYLLPDGSEVYLAAGSRLYSPAKFDGNTRELSLEGEAFFQVKRDESKPFIVRTGKIQTRVLGTSFKINANQGQPVVVSVATGKVTVSADNIKQTQTLAILTPGLKVTWNSKTGRAVQGKVDIYGLEQWKSGSMVFDDQTMSQIALELQRRYAVKIDFIDAEMANMQISGTFPSNKTIGQVMTALAIAGKFRFETQNNKSFKIFNTARAPM